MKPSNLVLRGFAERDEDGSWFAICLDLNLYARGDSFEEAKDKLQRLIRTYLTEAVTVDADYVDINSRAALYHLSRSGDVRAGAGRGGTRRSWVVQVRALTRSPRPW